jgi:hypothetical protein
LTTKLCCRSIQLKEINTVSWASELYWPSGHVLSAKLVPTFADKGCCIVSITDPCGRNLSFIDQSHYYFFQVASQLNSRSWVDPVPDPLLLRKSHSSRNRARNLWIWCQELWPLDHRVGHMLTNPQCFYILCSNKHACILCESILFPLYVNINIWWRVDSNAVGND